jgi:hypothetical protein
MRCAPCAVRSAASAECGVLCVCPSQEGRPPVVATSPYPHPAYRLSAFSAFSVFGIGVWGCCLRLVESPAASSQQELQLLVALLAASRPWPGLQKSAPFAVLCALSSPLCGVHATEDLRRGHRSSRALGGIGRQLRVRRVGGCDSHTISKKLTVMV